MKAKIAKCNLGESRSEVEMRGDSKRQRQEERPVRSLYLALKNQIDVGEIEDAFSLVDSEKFEWVINQVERLHELVNEPREQVADADVLLDIVSKLATAVKAYANQSVTPADFIGFLLRTYKQQGAVGSWERSRSHVSWAQLGIAVSLVFRKTPGCCTMIGPMKTELKQRKAAVRRRRSKPANSICPERVGDGGTGEKTDTDKNMAAMFDILRQKGHVRLENLALNRSSFAQTVENIFALSFLAKDGRVEITINEDGHHLVFPRNAPTARAVSSGEVCFSHFLFRFDYEDWKLMIEGVRAGEELMPHRHVQKMSGNS